jgi:thioester reductase-like protein
MGYARSKLVAERIIKAAAERTGMVARVLRIGQIIGDSEFGIWNTTEAIPLMIQSAVTMGVLPDLDEVCVILRSAYSPMSATGYSDTRTQTPSWLPVDVVARVVLELSGLPGSPNGTFNALHDPPVVYHVQNPKVFHWTRDLLPALREAGLFFETVSQREWVARLRRSEPDPTKNPTVKLLDFYSNKYDNDEMGRRELSFATEKTAEASPTLKEGYDIVGSGIVTKLVKEWRTQW